MNEKQDILDFIVCNKDELKKRFKPNYIVPWYFLDDYYEGCVKELKDELVTHWPERFDDVQDIVTLDIIKHIVENP